MQRESLHVFTVIRVLLTLSIIFYHGICTDYFKQNDVLLIGVFDKFYLGVDGFLLISGWLNA